MTIAHEDVGALRARIEAARAAAAQIENRPADDAEISDRVGRLVDLLADRARDSLGIDLLTAPDGDERMSEIGEQIDTLTSVEMMALVDPAKLRKSLADVAIAGRSGIPMSGPAKRAELDRLADEIMDLEVAEEMAIRATEVDGVGVRRRGDADPRVVLADDHGGDR